MLAGRSPEDMAGIFPNCMVTLRDGAHSSKRVITRPQAATPRLKEITDKILWLKTSIVMRIQNSHVFRDIFEEETKKEGHTEHGLGCADFGGAKHRLSGRQVPAARHTLWFHALIRAALRIMVERQSQQEGHDALSYLRLIDEEAYLMVAAWAEACAVVMKFTRWQDTEDCPSRSCIPLSPPRTHPSPSFSPSPFFSQPY